MKITSVRIKKNNNNENDNLLGTASVQFDNCLVLHNLKLIQGKDRRMVCFPNRKVKKYIIDDEGFSTNFEYADIVHPSTKEFRQYIEDELFRIFDNEIKEENNE